MERAGSPAVTRSVSGRPAARRGGLRAVLTPRDDGTVVIRLSGRGAAGVTTLGLRLDGVLRDMVPAAGPGRFVARLPRHVAHEVLALALPDGTTLAETLALRPVYRLRLAEGLSQEGVWLRGAVTASPWLGGALGVELLRETGALAGAGIARPDGAGQWRFAVALAALPPPDGAMRLVARVAGVVPAQEPVTVTAASVGFAGCLDGASPGQVEGWAVDLRDPARRVTVEITLGNDVVGRSAANLLRVDLKAAGVGDGRCGFGALLPEQKDPLARMVIGARIAGTPTHLAGSPVIVEPTPQWLGRFDTLHGMSAHGWALDSSEPARKMVVEAVGPEGEVLGQAVANVFRGDLLGAGHADGLCAFKIDISAHYDRLLGQEIRVRFAGTNVLLPGSPQRVLPNGNLQRFLRRRDRFRAKPGVLPRLKRALTHRAGTDGVSIIMPVHETPRQWLMEALESVRQQFCDNWELLCVDDGSRAPHVREMLETYARSDKRVRVLASAENVGVARAVNFGLRAARYDLVLFLDHDDYLEPDAVWQFIRAARETGADLLYGDEVLTDEHLRGILEPRLRPAFSHDYYLSHPYFVHPVCVRTELARRLGGWDESLKISGDVDFVLRTIEHARRIAHVPAVLYRWRTHETSTGHAKQEQVMAATVGALQRHLDRMGTGARAGEGAWFNQFRIDWPARDGLILVVIPTKNGHAVLRKAVDSLERTAAGARYRLVVIDHESDEAQSRDYLAELSARHVVMPYAGPFNFSRMNNEAVRRHGADADFVLFLNNDVEATEDGWLARLASLAGRPDVGAVGALLMYPDRSVQHAGVVLGFNNSADHALRLQNVFLDRAGRRNLGYNCSLTSVRDFSAVTAACVMLRRAVFDAVGGFDEEFGIGFNDTDLCLRVRQAGYRVLYDGHTVLYHYESATRSQTKQVFHPEDTKRMVRRWGKLLKAGDPFYNPNLSLRTQDHVPAEDPDCRIVHRPRVTDLAREGRIGQRPPGRPGSAAER